MPYPSLTIERLSEACREWQKRLRLQDWDIDLKIVRYFDLESQGRCTTIQCLKTAHIEIRDGADSSRESVADYDMESTLLHELLHIHFDALQNDFETKSTIRTNAKCDVFGETYKDVALEQAFCGLVPWMMSVARVIPLED